MADALKPTSRYLRYARIGWTSFWVLICVLLLVLWIRSYWRFDGCTYGFVDKRGFIVETQYGELVVEYLDVPVIGDTWYGSHPPDRRRSLTGDTSTLTFAGFHFPSNNANDANWFVVLPFYFLSFLSGALAAIPWIPPRLTARQILIAMTVAAMILGLILWAAYAAEFLSVWAPDCCTNSKASLSSCYWA
jgi:hypothetical protein